MSIYLRRTMTEAVSAAANDVGETLSRVEELFNGWGARYLRSLIRRSLRLNVHRTSLRVHHTTKTATLPCDVREVYFVGFVDENGFKVPLTINNNIMGQVKTPEDCCDRCGQPKDACASLATETYKANSGVTCGGNPVLLPDTKIIRWLNASGGYVEEQWFPVVSSDDCSVAIEYKKSVVASLELLPCGCVAPTAKNVSCIYEYCKGCYDRFYAPSVDRDMTVATVNIFLDEGYLQFSKMVHFDHVIIEYGGDLPRQGRNILLPDIAFESVVAHIVAKYYDRKKVPLQEKAMKWAKVEWAEKEMNKNRGRLSVADIIESAHKLPVV